MSALHPGIQIRIEGRRGCGYRKPGGLYLVSDGPGVPCGKLPIALHVCPTCGAGIKPSRGWTWIDGTALAAESPCRAKPCRPFCALSQPMGRVGLLWIGEQFYATPQEFQHEAERMGISRRLSAVPKDFVLGRTWIWLAHRKVEIGGEPQAAVFRVFLPDRIEQVVTGDEPDEAIDALLKRGITPVVVKRPEQQPGLGLGEEAGL